MKRIVTLIILSILVCQTTAFVFGDTISGTGSVKKVSHFLLIVFSMVMAYLPFDPHGGQNFYRSMRLCSFFFRFAFLARQLVPFSVPSNGPYSYTVSYSTWYLQYA